MTVRASERAFSLAACAVMFLWPVVTTDFDQVNAVSIVVAIGALILGAFVYFRNAPLWLVTAFAVGVGIALRLTTPAYGGSDVAVATNEALHALGAGLNPYHHYYTSTNPPGQPFPYLPGELGLYAIQHAVFGNLNDHDRWWGIGGLLGVAAFAPVCGAGRTALGTALLAVSSANVLLAVDGSNDTGLLLLLVMAIVALVYAAARPIGAKRDTVAIVLYVLSAALFGWAIAFKALVWIVFPFVVRAIAPQRRWLYAGVALGVALLICIPFVIMGPLDFFRSIGAGFTSHDNVWGFNAWSALRAANQTMADALAKAALPVTIFATVFTALTVWTRKPGTLGEALLQGCFVLGATLLFARWTSLAYYAFLIGAFALAIATFGCHPEPFDSGASRLRSGQAQSKETLEEL